MVPDNFVCMYLCKQQLSSTRLFSPVTNPTPGLHAQNGGPCQRASPSPDFRPPFHTVISAMLISHTASPSSVACSARHHAAAIFLPRLRPHVRFRSLEPLSCSRGTICVPANRRNTSYLSCHTRASYVTAICVYIRTWQFKCQSGRCLYFPVKCGLL